VATEAGVIDFRVQARSGEARTGVLSTPHGDVTTPAFMPVATQASVKGLDAADLSRLGVRMVIMNTYHLWLRPGAEVVQALGGLHGFSRFPGAIVTDSGGFQAFSLAERTVLREEGVEFSSHLDGRRLLLSPEEAMRVQGLLGADVAMQLDVCPRAGAPREEVEAAVARTTRWAERCLQAAAPGQAVFGIVQGGIDVELRLEHAEALARLPFAGLALGGFSVGEPNDAMHHTLARVAPKLDPLRPRYLMGVGTPEDLLRAVGVGVDMFDCVIPTRNARNGQAFTRSGRVAIRNARHRDDPSPLEADCGCPACAPGYGRGYLRHLHIANEMTAARLITLHNLAFYTRLLAEAKSEIERGSYESWAASCLKALESGDSDEAFGG
jgi:queuine tRNA-ribosyltransferase